MAELKTKANKRKSVKKFLDGVKNEKRRSDAYTLVDIMKEVTKCEPVMWGDSIIGFDTYRYTRKSDALTADWFPVGFSPRTTALVLYMTPYFNEYDELVAALGTVVKRSVGCIYVKDLERVDYAVLKQLIRRSVHAAKHLV